MDYKKLIKEAQQEQEKSTRLYQDTGGAASKTATALMIVGIAVLSVCLGILLFL